MDKYMAITPLPDPPSRADSTNFAQRGDAFMAALPPFAIELNALAADVTAKQSTASAAAVTAIEQAGIATNKAGQAAASEGVATTKAGEAAASEAAAFAYKGAAATSASNASDSEAAAAASAASVDAKGFATDYAGPAEPPVMWALMTWADTGNMLLKRRNAAGTAWVTEDYLLMSLEDRRWASFPVGHMEPVRDDIAGIPIPPTDNPHFRYIKLTAGDAYNSGILTGETVSGSAPTIVATAVISLTGSPLNGRAVHLENTMRTFSRAGAAGVLEGSQNASHNHTASAVAAGVHSHGVYFAAAGGGSGAGLSSPVSTGPNNFTGGYIGNGGDHSHTINIAANGGDENRSRNIGKTMYMRVK